MKTIEVSAAVIREEDKILATQRGYGEFKDGWEFPGGKLEKGESAEAAIIREIREELSVVISIEQDMGIIEYTYPTFHLVMHVFLCHIVDGLITLNEHENARWLTRGELDEVDWLPADELVLPVLKIS